MSPPLPLHDARRLWPARRRAVIRPVPGEWHPRMPERLDEEELADWRAGRNAVYQLAALTIGARLAVAEAWAVHEVMVRLGARGKSTPGVRSRRRMAVKRGSAHG
jgi:hypothetical protein